MRTNALRVLISCAFSLTATLAHAQTDLERATARDSANSGRAAFDAGQYEQAIDSFSRAESLVHAPPHLLFLARSQAKLGRLVAAHETYLKITRETLKPNAPKAFSDAQSAAEQELPVVDARLPSVTVTLSGAPGDGVTVQMDGAALPSAMIGIPLPADPGSHVFKASGNATSDPVTVTLSEASKQIVVLKVHRTSDASAAAAPPAAGSAPDAALGSDTADRPSHGSGRRVAAYASFGVGALGLGLGTYFLVKASNARKDADALYGQCRAISPQGNCGTVRDQFASKDNAADGQRAIGVTGLVVGGVGVAAGITLLILDAHGSRQSARHDAPRVTPVIGLNTLGLAGTF